MAQAAERAPPASESESDDDDAGDLANVGMLKHPSHSCCGSSCRNFRDHDAKCAVIE